MTVPIEQGCLVHDGAPHRAGGYCERWGTDTGKGPCLFNGPEGGDAMGARPPGPPEERGKSPGEWLAVLSALVDDAEAAEATVAQFDAPLNEAWWRGAGARAAELHRLLLGWSRAL